MIAAVLLLAGGVGAGIFGSLLGLGGGVLLVPLLTLGFGRPLRESVAVALVCVIVTSSAATRVYLQNKVANLRLGMYLALFTALGSLIGGAIAFLLDERVLAVMFAVLLGYVAISMAQAGRSRGPTPGPAVPPGPEPVPVADAPLASGHATFTDGLAGDGYRVRRVVPAAGASIGSGIVSALLGVGGGTINVPTMHLLMGAPLRVATATSNLMVGVTAIASTIIYFSRGEIDPWIAGPTAVGVFAGATIGSKNAHRVDVRVLRWLFVVVLSYTALQMALRAAQG